MSYYKLLVASIRRIVKKSEQRIEQKQHLKFTVDWGDGVSWEKMKFVMGLKTTFGLNLPKERKIMKLVATSLSLHIFVQLFTLMFTSTDTTETPLNRNN